MQISKSSLCHGFDHFRKTYRVSSMYIDFLNVFFQFSLFSLYVIICRICCPGCSLPWHSGWGLRFNISGHGLNSHPGDHYFVLVSGQLAEKLLDHNAWWTPLADGKIVLQRMLIISQLMYFRCWKS
jgi:hypothetical protein